MTKREQYEKLLSGMLTIQYIPHLLLFYIIILFVLVHVDGALMFHQVPLVEIDGMQLVQSKAILNYIAGKYNLYGKDFKERVM